MNVNLRKLTGQESGIVVANGRAMAVDWGHDDGVPLMMAGKPVTLPIEVGVTGGMVNADIAARIDGLPVGYDHDGDLPLKAGTHGDAFFLSNGMTVYAPRGWR